jgi:hypothetical protein
VRIFLSCLQALRPHPVPAYGYWETYFKRGIEEAGHAWLEAEGVDWAEGLLYAASAAASEWRARTWESVVRQVTAAHMRNGVDLFLSYLYPSMVDVEAIAAIRRLGIPCVNFFCDNVREFTRAPSVYRAFDLNWVPELEAARMYQQDGVPYIHAPMPTWVPPEHRTANHTERYGVTFIGSRDAQRERLIRDALALGAMIDLRGAGWAGGPPAGGPRPTRSLVGLVRNQWAFARAHGVGGWFRKMANRRQPGVHDEVFAPFVRPRPDAREYVEISQQSRVVLGINRYPSVRRPFATVHTYSKGRDIEAPMMGACYLTEWAEELEHMYTIGVEIETYRTAEDMVEKIRHLERDPVRRARMRASAQQRALTEHSVPRSLERIFDNLGVPVVATPRNRGSR